QRPVLRRRRRRGAKCGRAPWRQSEGLGEHQREQAVRHKDEFDPQLVVIKHGKDNRGQENETAHERVLRRRSPAERRSYQHVESVGNRQKRKDGMVGNKQRRRSEERRVGKEGRSWRGGARGTTPPRPAAANI